MQCPLLWGLTQEAPCVFLQHCAVWCMGYRPTTGFDYLVSGSRTKYSGLYSAKVVCPLSSTTDTIGVFAHRVETIQKVHKSIVLSYTPEKRVLSGVRIGIPRQHYYSVLDSEVSRVTEAALQSLKEADVSGLNCTYETYRLLRTYETGQLLPKYLKEQEAPVSFEELCMKICDPVVKKTITTASDIPEEKYHESVECVKDFRKQFDEYFETNKLNGFVVPTTILPTVKRPSPATVQVSGKEFPLHLAYTHNCMPQAVAGVPCISIPSGLSSDGRPIGLELVAPREKDSNLLDLAAAIQAILPPLQILYEDFKDQQLACV